MKLNRIVSLILVLVLLSASAFAELVWDFTAGSGSSVSFGESESFEESYICTDYVLISGGNCNVREYPALSANSIGVLNNGQTADCTGMQSIDERGVVWYEIEYKGRTAWVSSKYAKLNGVGTTTSYVTIVGGQCNLRLTPDLNGEVLAILKEGVRAVYEGSTSTDNRGVDWYQVSYNGQAGWVSSRYARFGNYTSAASYGYVKATSHKVNLRDEPNLNGEDIGTMDKGETATYLGKKSTDSRGVVWYKVRFNGKTGWVSSRYSKLYN